MKTKDEIRHYLSLVPGLNHQAELTYQYLAQGITNENYKINLDGKQYVLRINSPDSNRLGIQRKEEVKVLNKISHLKLAPSHVFFSQEADFFLTRWIEGKIWKKADLEKEVNLNRLAQKLKQLHSQPSENLVPLDISSRLDLYRHMIRKRHGKLPKIEQRLIPQVISLLGAIGHSQTPCLCHNDLLSPNIITSNINNNETILFLDWEYAAIHDPLFELAVICQGNQLSQESQNYLLQAYLGDSAAVVSQEFELWCWLYDYLSLLWGLVILPEDISLPENLNQLFQQLTDTLP